MAPGSSYFLGPLRIRRSCSVEPDRALEGRRCQLELIVRSVDVVHQQERVRRRQRVADLDDRVAPAELGGLVSESTRSAPPFEELLALEGHHGDAELPGGRRFALATALVDLAHLGHGDQDTLDGSPRASHGAHGLEQDHERPHPVDVVLLHGFGGTVERVGHDGEPVAVRADDAAPQLAGVIAPELHGVGLPNHVAGFAGERVREERLGGDAVHRLHPLVERADGAGDGGEVEAHPPALDLHVVLTFPQEPFDHEEDELDAFQVHPS